MPYKDIEKRREANRKYREKNRVKCKRHREKKHLQEKNYGCQFDGCEIDDFYMLDTHHLFPGNKEITIVLCVNHHRLIDHFKEGFYNSKTEG